MASPLLDQDVHGNPLPDLPVQRPRSPGFATIGRPPPRDGLWSKPLMLLIAVGIFASFLALIVGLQAERTIRPVEVTFMEEEAAAAEAGLSAPGAPQSDD